MTYTRTCKNCNGYFSTDRKNSCVCPKCHEINHRKKIEKTLFGGDILFLTIIE